MSCSLCGGEFHLRTQFNGKEYWCFRCDLVWDGVVYFQEQSESPELQQDGGEEPEAPLADPKQT